MPDLTGNASTFRAGNYRQQGYLAMLPQTVVFSRAVNQTTFTYPLTTLTFDNAYSGVGLTSDVVGGMTVRIYDGNTTTLKGTLRVAAGGASGFTLQINEVSNGAIDIANNDRIDVVEEYRIREKLVSNDGDFNKDSRISYTDQTDLYAPVACGGGAWAGFVDDGGSVATVSFDATDSYTIDPDSNGSITYLWNVDGGTITVGSTSTSTITATFAQGAYSVSLTVTDASNSKTSTIYIPVLVYDANNMPLSVIMESIVATTEQGWSGSFTLPVASQSDAASLPDGAPVFYFERETYNGTAASYGSNAPADRNHMKLAGYLDSENLTYDADTNEVSFEIVSPLRMLEKIGALPQILIRDDSPANWQEASDLTPAIMFWYLWAYGASLMHDIVWLDGRNFAQARLTVNDASSVAGQLRDIGNSLNLQITCDRLGRLYAVRNPNYESAAERNSRTTTYNFTTDDFVRVEVPKQHHRATKTVRGEGIIAASTVGAQAAVFSDAPGDAPGAGAGADTLSRQIVASQTDINQRTGYRFAEVNSLYRDSSTRAIYIVPKAATLTVPDGYDVFDPAYREFVTLVISDAVRGEYFTSDDRWTVEAVSVTYNLDTGAKEITHTINHETTGNPGVTYIPPAEEDNGLPAFDLPSFDLPSFEVPALSLFDQFWVNKINGVMAVFPQGTGSTIYITTNWKDASPEWSAVNLSPIGAIRDFTVDAADPDSCWITSNTAIYKVADLFGTPAITSEYSYVAVANGTGRSTIRGTIANPLTVLCAIGYNTTIGRNGVYVTSTTDGGTTWATEQLLTSGNNTFGIIAASEVSPRTAATMYAMAPTTTGSLPDITLYRSVDSGANWSAFITDAAVFALPVIHVPVDGASDVVWYVSFDNQTPSIELLRSDTGATNYVSGLTDGTYTYAPSFNNGFKTAANNASNIVMAAQTATSSAYINWRVFSSSDTGATWIESDNPDNTQWAQVAIDGIGDKVYAFSNQGQIGVQTFSSLQSGAGFTDKTGNLSISGEIIGIMGGGN